MTSDKQDPDALLFPRLGLLCGQKPIRSNKTFCVARFEILFLC